ncbi:MAG: cytidine deaminase, partial [Candidatus Caldatribacteriaceae bacterium]
FHQDIDTDVIAFPYGENEKDKVWGEILICIPVAQKQAGERKTKVEEEIIFLFIHGLLHLLGYRDTTAEERNAMDTKSAQFFCLFSEWQLRKKLVQEACRAKNFAYAPYSRFRVGVALLGEGKKIFTGCNVENASFGLTICAERVALFKAVSMGIQKFEKIAIVSDSSKICLPCGACRQVLAEFAPSLEVISATASLDFRIFRLEELLPHRFYLGEGDLQ